MPPLYAARQFFSSLAQKNINVIIFSSTILTWVSRSTECLSENIVLSLLIVYSMSSIYSRYRHTILTSIIIIFITEQNITSLPLLPHHNSYLAHHSSYYSSHHPITYTASLHPFITTILMLLPLPPSTSPLPAPPDIPTLTPPHHSILPPSRPHYHSPLPADNNHCHHHNSTSHPFSLPPQLPPRLLFPTHPSSALSPCHNLHSNLHRCKSTITLKYNHRKRHNHTKKIQRNEFNKRHKQQIQRQ